MLPEPERVAVLRALRLGDLLVAVPALRAMRAAWPNAHVTLVGLPWARWFADRFRAYVDDFVEAPAWPGLAERPADPASVPRFLRAAQERRDDLAVQMHGNGTVTNPLVALMGAARTAGYYLPGQFCPDPETFLPYPAHEPERRRHLALAAHLGAPDTGDHLELPVLPEDEEALGAEPALRRIPPEGYLVVNAGAGDPARRWPPERFAEVIDGLAGELPVVLTGSPEDADAAAAVAARTRRPVVNVAGRLDLGALAALVARARLVLTNDTGMSHVADALAVPSVVVFTASDPMRWAPGDRRLHRIVAGPSVEVNPCRHGDGGDGGHRCLRDACLAGARDLSEIERDGVPVADVLAECLDLLASGSAGR